MMKNYLSGVELPYILLAITLATFPFDKWNPFLYYVAPADQAITLPEVFTILTMIIWLIYIFLLGRTQYLRDSFKSPATICVLIYLLVSLLSAACSFDPLSSLGAVLKRTALFVIYLMIINIVRDRRGLEVMIGVLSFSAIAYLLAGLYELFTGDMFLSEMALGRTELVGAHLGKIRVQGLETDPDLLNVMLFLLSGPILFRLVSAERAVQRIFWCFVLLVLVINVIATGSRWGWVGICFIIGAFFLFVNFHYKGVIAFVGGVILVAVFMVMAMVPTMMVVEKIERMFTKTQNDIGFQERKAKIRMAIDMAMQNPFLGVGSGNSGKETSKFLRRGSRVGVRDVESSISGFATLLGDNGVLGFFVYISMILVVILGVVTNRAYYIYDVMWNNLGGCILISLLAFIFCMIAYPSFGCRYAWVIFGLGTAYASISKGRDGKTFSPSWVLEKGRG